MINNEKELRRIIRLVNNGEYNTLFRSIDRWDKEKEHFEVDTLFLDFDCAKDIQLARQETFLVIKRMNKLGIRYAGLYYSGSKGFHLEYKFPTVKLTKEEYREFKSKLRDFMFGSKIFRRLKTLDRITTYKRKGFRRMPGSRHNKSGRYCIPIKLSDVKYRRGIDNIIECSKKEPKTIFCRYNKRMNEELYDMIINTPTNYREEKIRNINTELEKISEYYDITELPIVITDGAQISTDITEGKWCTKYFIQRIEEGTITKLPHSLRVIIARDLIFNGQLAKAYEVMRRLENYNRHDTYYQLNNLMQNRCRPVRCSKIREMVPWMRVLCAICPYYRHTHAT